MEELFFKYNEVLRVLRGIFNFSQESDARNSENYNPIAYEKSRIKSQKSIAKKLYVKNHVDFTVQNIEKNLEDVAGYRIVCPFLSDIPKIIDYIKASGIKIIKTKDYIKNPKKSCYKGYHMIVEVPIEINGQTENVKAEIQIRTMSQNVVASIDHKIRYKNENYIKEFFDSLFKSYQETEQRLQNIFSHINEVDTKLDSFIQERKAHLSKESKPKQIPATCNIQELEYLKTLYAKGLDNIETIITNLIKTKFLDKDLVNPVEHIKKRIKPTDSIISKLEENNREVTTENIIKYVNDMGAMKIVCSFLDDVELVINEIEELATYEDFEILDRQDYITAPKECGYSSYHFVVAVPVEINNQIINVKTEIQVRTLAMDLWAAIEDILCYKKETDIVTREEMKRIAADLRNIDIALNKVARVLNKKSNGSTKETKTENSPQLIKTKGKITTS